MATLAILVAALTGAAAAPAAGASKMIAALSELPKPLAGVYTSPLLSST